MSNGLSKAVTPVRKMPRAAVKFENLILTDVFLQAVSGSWEYLCVRKL